MGAINTVTEESFLLKLTPQFVSLKRDYSSLEYSYTSIQRNYSPSHQESRLQLDMKVSMSNLGAIVENSALMPLLRRVFGTSVDKMFRRSHKNFFQPFSSSGPHTICILSHKFPPPN